MKKMINRKILILISLLLFLPLLVGCFLFPSANQSPTITSTPITTATVGEEYTYDVEATDPDSGDTLTYSLTTSPTGMDINSITGVINWAPTSAQIGDYNVTVEVSDGSLSDTQSFIIVVSEAPPAYPAPPAPTPTPTPTYTVTYDGNGSTGGTVPSDANNYEQGDSVTVLGKGDLVKTDYVFAGWNTQADGNGTDRAPGSTFNMGSENVTLYAKWTPPGTYSIGDVGPAGGFIFYDKGYVSDGWRYLEAAPASTEWTPKQWGSYETLIGGTGTGIGTGQSNTTAIVTWLDNNTDNTYGDVTSKTDRAAYLCDALIYGGYDDWFLPSKDELDKLYINKVAIGGFAGVSYWSSSEFTAFNAWLQSFYLGIQHYALKDSTGRVRAIRAF